MGQTLFLRNVPAQEELSVAVIAPRFGGNWVFCRRKGQTGWELPGGHRQPGETILEAARRELWEETGIRDAALHLVDHFDLGDLKGALYFAEVAALGQLPEDTEMEQVQCIPLLPESYAYPNLPVFYEHVQAWLNLQSGADELWDVYDTNRNLTGRLHRRGDPLPEGDCHLVVHIWIRRADGKYLLTKRSPNKGFPNMWETTGGSALAGDDSLTAAMREVWEETGLQLAAENGRLVECRPWFDHFDDIWLFCQEFDLQNVKLLEGETCDAMAATPQEILHLHRTGCFFPTENLDALLEKMEAM